MMRPAEIKPPQVVFFDRAAIALLATAAAALPTVLIVVGALSARDDVLTDTDEQPSGVDLMVEAIEGRRGPKAPPLPPPDELRKKKKRKPPLQIDPNHDAAAPDEMPPDLYRHRLCPNTPMEDPRFCPPARTPADLDGDPADAGP